MLSKLTSSFKFSERYSSEIKKLCQNESDIITHLDNKTFIQILFKIRVVALGTQRPYVRNLFYKKKYNIYIYETAQLRKIDE